MKKMLILLFSCILFSSCGEEELNEINLEEELNEINLKDQQSSGGSGGVILVPDPLL